MNELRYSESLACPEVLIVARQAWETGFPTVQMEALDFVHSNARAIRDAGAEAESAIIELLESFDVKDNILLSTQWLETRSSFSGFEIGLDAMDAAEEYRRILATAEAGDDPLYHLERESNPSMTFTEFAATWASSALGKIFEDVFQGIYYEAYESLSDDERKSILTLALRNPRFSSFADWYLDQLSKYGFADAEDILARYGCRIDVENFCPQDAVACFVMANQAWAKISDMPLQYQDTSTPDHRAWAIMGELVFWLNRSQSQPADRVAFLCRELANYPEALPDLFRQIEHSNWKHIRPASPLQPLLEQQSTAIRDALQESLKSTQPLTSVFRGGPMQPVELFRWTVSKLGDIGDRNTVCLLQSCTESAVFGKDAIRAIEQIEHRIASRA